MKKNSDSEIARFINGEDGFLIVGPNEDAIALENAMRTMEAALLCIGEGNIARAGQLLYGALPPDRRQAR